MKVGFEFVWVNKDVYKFATGNLIILSARQLVQKMIALLMNRFQYYLSDIVNTLYFNRYFKITCALIKI